MYHLIVVLCALVTIATASPFNWRIVGGWEAVEGQFPYQVSLREYGSHNCGGTILNNRWILTAAQCVYRSSAKNLLVAVGSIRRNDETARTYGVEQIIVHNKWNSWRIRNDIALLRVNEDIEFNDNVQAIPINTDDIGDGASVLLSGWGTTSYPGRPADILQWIELRSITVKDCQSYHYRKVVDSQLCTLTRSGEGACHGDSGGPLVYNGRVAGIVSWGRPCAVGYPDVFTRVSSFAGWIQERIN